MKDGLPGCARHCGVLGPQLLRCATLPLVASGLRLDSTVQGDEAELLRGKVRVDCRRIGRQ